MFSSYALCFLRERLQFRQDGGEILRNRRMNMHCALYDRIGRLRIHHIQQNVDYFIASGPEDRGAQNLFCFRVNTDFDETLCLPFLKRPAHSDHRIFRASAGRPDLRISASVMPQRPSGGSMYSAYAWIRSETRRWSPFRRLSATIS